MSAETACDWAIAMKDEDKYMARCDKLNRLVSQLECLEDVHGIRTDLLISLYSKKVKEIERGGPGLVDLKAVKPNRTSDAADVDTAGHEEEFLVAVTATAQFAPVHQDIVTEAMRLCNVESDVGTT